MGREETFVPEGGGFASAGLLPGCPSAWLVLRGCGRWERAARRQPFVLLRPQSMPPVEGVCAQSAADPSQRDLDLRGCGGGGPPRGTLLSPRGS